MIVRAQHGIRTGLALGPVSGENMITFAASSARLTSGSRKLGKLTLDARFVSSAWNPSTWASLDTESARSAHVRRADSTCAGICAADLLRHLSGWTQGAGIKTRGIGKCSGLARLTSLAILGWRGSSRACHALGTVSDLSVNTLCARALVLAARGRHVSIRTHGADLILHSSRRRRREI
jgi:hypothetical protein